MHSILRPNYRRARALAGDRAARVHLDEARSDPSYTLDDIEDLKAELHHLEREFSLTGVTSGMTCEQPSSRSPRRHAHQAARVGRQVRVSGEDRHHMYLGCCAHPQSLSA